MLQEWLAGLKPDEYLFPRLAARRRTWLMVKKDLERVGIPYVTKEGVADFHAAGRHTHITELLRNGATLPEARELARHSDIKMTLKYTHIGLADQARAVAALPNPCQHIVSISGDSGGQRGARDGNGRHSEGEGTGVGSPCDLALSDPQKQTGSSDDSDDPEWRRRELNPRPVIPRRWLLRV